MKSPKVRADAWYAALSEEECWKIYELARKCPISEVIAYIKKEHAIATSVSALYVMLKRYRALAQQYRVEQTIVAMSEAEELAAANGASDRVAAGLKAIAAELVLSNASAQQAKPILQMALGLEAETRKSVELDLKKQRLAIEAERTKLDREKFEAQERRLSEASGVLRDEGLSDQERLAKIREVFGIK